ncbi:hypothetical protein D1007_60041 [Hordeum vulgare]|nr:hypothetical protein D1007_60041 [Hordeum vulgare]
MAGGLALSPSLSTRSVKHVSWRTGSFRGWIQREDGSMRQDGFKIGSKVRFGILYQLNENTQSTCHFLYEMEYVFAGNTMCSFPGNAMCFLAMIPYCQWELVISLVFLVPVQVCILFCKPLLLLLGLLNFI